MENNTHIVDAERGTAVPSSGQPRSDGRTCLEKVLICLLGLVVLVAIILATLLAQPMNKNEEVCLTKECSIVAAQVIKSIDYSVDPCEDFYDYACGSWMKSHVIPDDRSNLYTYGVVRDNVKVTVKYLLEDDGDDGVTAVRQARDYYRSCMNETSINTLNTSVLTDLLEDLGGWPTLRGGPGGHWNEATFDFLNSLISARLYGSSPFIRIYIGPDDRIHNERIIHLAEANVDMRHRKYLLGDEHAGMRDAYVRYGRNVAVMLGASPIVAEHDMNQLLRLSIKLANVTMTRVQRRDRESLYNKMTLGEMVTAYPETVADDRLQFDWVTYLQYMLDMGKDNVTVNETEPIILMAPNYYRNIFDILRNEDIRTIQNYIMWRIVSNLISLLPKRFGDEMVVYRRAVLGTGSSKSRWKTCSESTMVHFGMAVGRLFVKQTFDRDAKGKALDMIHGIREAFYERLEELDWMDKDTKDVAKDKAKHIEEKIGYPDFILDDEKLNAYYKELHIDSDAYFRNTINITKIYSMHSFKNLRNPYMIDKSHWETPPSTVNAYYSPQQNQISFPAGMLQPPYYSKYQPRSMNYGSIGWLIGHEITHGFDDVGRKYDKEGNLRQWWTDDAIRRFNRKIKCIREQYKLYLSPEAGMNANPFFRKGIHHVTGKLNAAQTVGEDIADNGGLQQSYRAYRNWVRRHGNEPSLPGLDFTHNQLFFINFAQGWCGVMTTKYSVDQILTDWHSPGRFRVIGSLQNSKDFSDAFSCPVGSRMNPPNKCQVW